MTDSLEAELAEIKERLYWATREGALENDKDLLSTNAPTDLTRLLDLVRQLKAKLESTERELKAESALRTWDIKLLNLERAITATLTEALGLYANANAYVAVKDFEFDDELEFKWIDFENDWDTAVSVDNGAKATAALAEAERMRKEGAGG